LLEAVRGEEGGAAGALPPSSLGGAERERAEDADAAEYAELLDDDEDPFTREESEGAAGGAARSARAGARGGGRGGGGGARGGGGGDGGSRASAPLPRSELAPLHDVIAEHAAVEGALSLFG
jgi:hypothetical protein